MGLREPMIYVAVGRRGIGKTVTTIDRIRQYVRTHLRPVLIFDVNGEFSNAEGKYPDIRAIAMRDVRRWSAMNRPEIRRILPFYDNGEKIKVGPKMAEVLEWILDNFFNGLLLVEDINKYVSDSMPSDLTGAICTNRHTGIDIILHYQSIGRVATKVWQNIDVLRMHRETGGVTRNRSKFDDKFEYFKIAENIVNAEFFGGNNRFYLTVDVTNEKILADVSEEKKKKAITDFLNENYREFVAPLMNQRDRADNSKVYDYDKAMTYMEDKLYNQYFLK
jgi:hypothetical protein